MQFLERFAFLTANILKTEYSCLVWAAVYRAEMRNRAALGQFRVPRTKYSVPYFLVG